MLISKNMSNIIRIKKAVIHFLKENIKCYDIAVVKIEKVDVIWNAVAEVYEDDSFLKALNMPPKQVRLFYSVRLDEDLEVVSFERINSFAGTESDAQ